MRGLVGSILLIVVLFSTDFGAGKAHAAVIQVGVGGCTLHDAIRAANANAPRGNCTGGSGADTIRLPGGQTQVLTGTLETVTSPIHFEPTAGTATVDGDANGVMFTIDGANVTFTDLIITNGRSCGASIPGSAINMVDSTVDFDNVAFTDHYYCFYPGGGYFYADNSTVTIDGGVFQDNTNDGDNICQAGGCPDYPNAALVFLNSDITIENSEFTGHDVDYQVVGTDSLIAAYGSMLQISASLFDSGPSGRTNQYLNLQDFSEATIENSTFSSQITERTYSVFASDNNQVTLNHATLVNTDFVFRGIASLSNSIFAGECNRINPGTIGLNAGNWFTTGNCGSASTGDLFLLSLLDRGGPTRTHGLHWLSDAIDAGSAAHCLAEDQRGVPRTAQCDIGAFERNDEADLSVAISSLNGAPFYAGQNLIYQVVLSNSGPGVANNAQVNFSSSNLAIDSVSGACTANPCVVNSVLPGASRNVYVHAHPTTPGATGFSLSAVVVNGPGSVYNDPNPGNNSDTENDNQVQAADLSITKSFISSPPFVVGNSIQYEVEVENLGPNLATGVVLTDAPSGLNITAITPCNNPPAGPCDLPNIASGNSVTRTVTAQITSTAFDNAASVSGSVYDPIAANNTDDQGNNGNTEADADVRGSTNVVSSPPYLSGDVITFGVGVRNYGPDTATNVLLDAVATGGSILGVADGCFELPCDFGTLTLNQTKEAEVLVQINTPGLVTLYVSAYADQTDTNQSNNTDDASVNAEATADIGVSLTPLTPPPYYAGQLINYRLNVSNLGFDPATNVEVAITTQNLDIVSAFGDFCLELPCNIPVLDIVQTESIDVVAMPIGAGLFDFTASGSADQYDFQPANDSDTTNNGGTALQLVLDLLFRDGMEDR